MEFYIGATIVVGSVTILVGIGLIVDVTYKGLCNIADQISRFNDNVENFLKEENQD